MPSAHRRHLLLGGAAFLLSGAQTAMAQAETENVPCQKVFPFLENYLNLPAAERTHFRLLYRFSVTGAKLSDVRLILKHNGETPITFGADGTPSPLPSQAALKAKAPVALTRPKGSKIGVNMTVASSLPAATSYTVTDLNKTVDQARSGAKKAAGLMGMAVPNFDRVVFSGVKSAQVVMSDGKTQALPVEKSGKPMFVPASFPNAARVTLDAAPTLIGLGTK
ncbi:MAG: hypothetical protein QM667_07970 [Asticcacaulis sp.]